MNRCLFSLLALSLLTVAAASGDDQVRVLTTFKRLRMSLGIEPAGGRFDAIIPAGAKVGTDEADKSCEFAIVTRKQPRSILSIYSTNSESLRGSNPLARYEISGLSRGRLINRVQVNMKIAADRTVQITAKDLEYGQTLRVTRLRAEDVAAAKLTKASTKTPALDPVASIDNTLPYAVGVRSGGGMFRPLLAAGSAPRKSATAVIRPRYPRQTTADVTLYGGDNHFIEENKIVGRYLVTGIPASDKRLPLYLKLTVGPDGQLAQPVATDATRKVTYNVEPYSVAAASRLHEDIERLDQVPFRRIPSAPVIR